MGESIRFGYSPAAAPFVYLTWAGAAVTAAVCTLIALSSVWMQIDRSSFDPRASLLAGGSLIVGWFVLLYFWTLYPALALDSRGIVLSFPIGRKRLDWSDIYALRTPGAGGRGSPVVLARRITPFHLVYGAIYARKLTPAFVIGWPLERREEVVEEIKKRLAGR